MTKTEMFDQALRNMSFHLHEEDLAEIKNTCKESGLMFTDKNIDPLLLHQLEEIEL